MVSSPVRIAAFAGLALFSGADVRGALGVAASGSSYTQVIAPHDGGAAFNEQMSRAQVLSTVEAELLDAMMEDPSVMNMVKSILKDALAGVVQSLSVAARESCDKLAESAAEKIEESSGVSHEEVEEENDETTSSFVAEQVQARVRSKLEQDGFFDDLKSKVKGVWNEAKGAAKEMVVKLALQLKPILEKAIASILPKLKGEANKLLIKACDAADQKLQAVHEKLQQHQ